MLVLKQLKVDLQYICINEDQEAVGYHRSPFSNNFHQSNGFPVVFSAKENVIIIFNIKFQFRNLHSLFNNMELSVKIRTVICVLRKFILLYFLLLFLTCQLIWFGTVEA